MKNWTDAEILAEIGRLRQVLDARKAECEQVWRFTYEGPIEQDTLKRYVKLTKLRTHDRMPVTLPLILPVGLMDKSALSCSYGVDGAVVTLVRK